VRIEQSCRSLLEIPPERFLARDLSRPWQPGDRPFDLILSLEVGEHLPADSAGEFVCSLARLGPVVLFSAAFPHQGGTNHVNEQWPDYWAQRFREVDYTVIDCIRELVWQNRRVECWYAQNILLFVRDEHLPAHPRLARAAQRTRPSQLSLVHPRLGYYVDFHRHLRERFRCVLENDLLVVFDLRT
jgi:hypothetical protein